MASGTSGAPEKEFDTNMKEEDVKEGQTTQRGSQTLIKVRSKSSITHTTGSINILRPRIRLKNGQENTEQRSMKELIDMQKQKSQQR